MRFSTPLSLAALLASASVHAEAQQAPVIQQTAQAAPGPHFVAAQRLYQKLDLDAAMAELQQAEVGAKDNEDELVQILIYRGLIFSETGRSGEAADMFKRALAMRPWAEVPADTSPRLAKVFGDARKQLWGSASQIKPPPKKSRGSSNAVPVSSTQPAPQAVPATATQTPAQ